MNKYILCVDIGGTHISSAVIEYDTLAIVDGTYFTNPVDSHADKDSILNNWNQLLNKSITFSQVPVEWIVVSIPGPFDYANGISQMDGMHKYQDLLHVDLKTNFSETHQINYDNIYFINDAQAYLLGEVHHFGFANDRVVGITLGTGLGSALFEDAEVKDLNFGSANYREGISEDYISTRGMLSYLQSISENGAENVKELVDSQELEQERSAVFSYLTIHLISFIEQYILPMSVDYLVIGGSIAKAHSLFLPQLEQSISVPIKISSFDEHNLFKGLAKTIQL
ncbi:ROK family protein [Sphingobacterium hungaricum]